MARIVSISDIHGRDCWKNIVLIEKDADKIIFLGDYFDSFDKDFNTQLNNWKDLMEYREANKDRVIMLTGNHDLHYFSAYLADDEYYSGFQRKHAQLINIELEEARKFLLAIHTYEDIVYSHAGITKTWLRNAKITVEKMNDVFKSRPLVFRWLGYDAYGDDIGEGPMWVRPRSLAVDKLDGRTMVVGHTRVKDIENYGDIWLTDVLEENRQQYLVYEDKKFKVEEF